MSSPRNRMKEKASTPAESGSGSRKNEQGTQDITVLSHNSIDPQVVTHAWKNRVEVLRTEAIKTCEDEINKLVDTVLSASLPEANGDALPRPAKNPLAPKQFVPRNSALTDLFEITHIQTIKHIFIAILIILLSGTIISDLYDHRTIAVDFRMWTWAFGKFPLVLAFWIAMESSALLFPYFGLCLWTYGRTNSRTIGGFDMFFITIYWLFLAGFAALPVYFIWANELPPASSAIVVGEQIRLMMKSHAFVREKAGQVINAAPQKVHIDFGKLLYFHFVPTLVYRDDYPRNAKVRWGWVAADFAQFVGGVMYTNYIFVRFCVPVFREFSGAHVNVETYVKTIMKCVLPGTLNFFVVFYAFLHSWMNAFAEMLRFADRMFYRDWWNSTTFANYYRTWNIVVHDWLYSYVYCDLYRLFGARTRHAAMFLTFLISAAVHEYIFIVMFRFLYPVIFVLFAGFGVWMVFVTKSRSAKGWNIIMWLSLFLGQGVLMCLYSSEYYARKNCPPSRNDFVDLLIPRSWGCFITHHPLETL